MATRERRSPATPSAAAPAPALAGPAPARLAALAALALAACDGGATAEPRITGASPPWGPLAGGTTIAISGAGFAPASGGGTVAAAPVRVLIGGREAPLATAVDDATLQVVIPFGDRPGDAEVVVLAAGGNARATGVFRYSTPPAIDAVSPADVLAAGGATRVTVTGSGFVDEDAGDVTVAVGDQLATDVVVESDTRLSFTAPAGRPFAEPELVIADGRGTATRPRSLRYIPSARGGLLLFPRFSTSFAVFVDPVAATMVQVPWIRAAEPRFTAVVSDGRGTFWGLDRSWRFGRLDLAAQSLVAPFYLGSWYPAAIRVGGELFAIERFTLRLGKIDTLTGGFTPISTGQLPCCSSYGLAFDGARFHATARQGTTVTINTIDPATGALGTPVPLAAGSTFQVEEMRFFEGTLYATSRDGMLVSIDPSTGAVTPIMAVGRNTAMEVFDPAGRP